MTQIPLDKAYLTAIWLETLLYGERVFRNLLLTPIYLETRNKLYYLLDLLLCSYQEEESDPMDHCDRSHFPVDGFYCSRVPWLYGS